MRICIITEYFATKDGAATGGVEARAFHVAKELAKKHDVTVITSWRDGMPRQETFSNLTVHHVGPHHPYTNVGAVVSRLRFSRAAYKEACRHTFDVIDGYNFVSYLPAYHAAKKTGAKSVATYHEIWLGSWIKNKGLLTGTLGSIWERAVVKKKWSRIIAVSECTKKKLEPHVRSPVVVIPNGVVLPQSTAADRTPQTPNHTPKFPGPRPPTICFVGRLTPQKRVIDLLDALSILKKHKNKALKNVRCIIVGTGPEEERLKEHAQKLGLGNISFLGFVKEQKDVQEILKTSTVLCHPSILEGFGMVLIEAMAYGTPYVCSDIDVFKEVTKNGKGGLLFQQKNPADLAEKIATLLTDAKKYAAKRNEAALLAQEYDWKRIAAQVEKVCQEVTRTGGGA